MERLQVVGWLLVLLCNVVRGDVVCMQCDGAIDIDECQRSGTIKCGPQEQCFLEKITTKNLISVFNAGCRSAAVCSIMATLGGGNGRRDLSRQSRDLVNCAQCCNTGPGVVSKGPCNSELCGQKPLDDKSLRCLDCDHLVSGAASCTERDVCTDTQVCATSIHILGGSQIKYNFRCEEKHLCEGMIKNGLQTRASEASGIKICDACCKDSECNKRDCFELRKMMPTLFGNATATTTKPVTPAATPVPSTAPSTVPSTPVPSTAPSTVPSTPVPSTAPSTVPSTPVPSTAPSTVPSTPVPSTAPSTVPSTPVPPTTTVKVPATSKINPPSSKSPGSSASSGSSRRPSTFAPNFTVI
ncbi:G8 domain-containing protein DDB_G0286311-like [Argopecten irradians]|uniref:G8 domain-containing protein DDB_G0286311-like n=1 Tax=Argopecten irradians TaxID=31199 RepID=UPI003714DAD2